MSDIIFAIFGGFLLGCCFTVIVCDYLVDNGTYRVKDNIYICAEIVDE